MATAISTRAALTYYYRLLRPNETTISWSVDQAGNWWVCDRCIVSNVLTKYSLGLPTRSRHVHEFISGMEKTKARDGETSQSTRAINFDDMKRLYKKCIEDWEGNERRQGIVRYVSYVNYSTNILCCSLLCVSGRLSLCLPSHASHWWSY